MIDREENPTELETVVATELRALLKARYPLARITVVARIGCPAIADTFMPCSKAFGHTGRHRVDCKDRDFDIDYSSDLENLRKP